jgi:hypothetical protein
MMISTGGTVDTLGTVVVATAAAGTVAGAFVVVVVVTGGVAGCASGTYGESAGGGKRGSTVERSPHIAGHHEAGVVVQSYRENPNEPVAFAASM